jgi:hypothetical protein
MTITNKRIISALNSARAYWSKIARDNGWYNERIAESPGGGFYVCVWLDKYGKILDSVYQPCASAVDVVNFGRNGEGGYAVFKNNKRLA